MKIKVIDPDVLEKKEACWGFSASSQLIYEVLAIKQWRKRKQYLVVYDMRLIWWDADLFDIIEEAIPEDWIDVRYKYFHKIKNKKYDFHLPIHYYYGPKSFLENEDFLFDTIEYPHSAYKWYLMQRKDHYPQQKDYDPRGSKEDVGGGSSQSG